MQDRNCVIEDLGVVGPVELAGFEASLCGK